MSVIRERIVEQINDIRQRNILPENMLLTPQTFQLILMDDSAQELLREGNHPAIAVREMFHLEFELGDSDMIIGKGLYPDECPICAHPVLMCRGRIYNLANIIKFMEKLGKRKSLLTCGHTVEIGVKEYRFPFDYSPLKTETKITACPKCGGQIKYISTTDAFCLDCDWDNLKPLKSET